ncbi:hypothetical protein PV783_13685 [Chitinophaga sp. CC14]|uniref:hypothetical protein n=1 Tax=Chitinophaga sp. CC14 TaxID=3029199 RepID=UPI003B77E51E
MNLKTILLLAFIIPISLKGLSQSDYQAGYIIKGKDTIRGYLFFPEGVLDPTIVRFKVMPGDKPVIYTCRQITGFSISGGELYMSKKPNLCRVEHRENDANVQISYLQISCFLKVLVHGELLSLYSLNGNERYFVEDNKRGYIYELGDYALEKIYKVEELEELASLGVKHIRVPQSYWMVLRRILLEVAPARFPAYRDTIEKLAFTEQALVNVVAYINSSDKPFYIAPSSKSTNCFSIYASGGVTVNQLSYEFFPIKHSLKFQPAFGPSLGIAYMLRGDDPQSNVGFRLGLTADYSYNSFTGPIDEQHSLRNYGYRLISLTPSVGVLLQGRRSNGTVISFGPEIAYCGSYGTALDQLWVENGVAKPDDTKGAHIVLGNFVIRGVVGLKYKKTEIATFIQFLGNCSAHGDDNYELRRYSAGITFFYRLYKKYI